MKRLMLAATLMALAGCAGVGPAGRSAEPCVPPGLPPFLTWRPGPSDMTITNDEAGRPRAVIRRGYIAGGQRVMAYWLEGLLIAVDPDPQDPETPVWMDEGAVAAADLTVRERPVSACRWTQGAGRYRPGA